MSIYTEIQAGRRAARKAEAIRIADELMMKAHAQTISAESYGSAALKARITAISNEIARLRLDMQEGKF